MHAEPSEAFSTAVISLNVRGLSEEAKLRHLINSIYQRKINKEQSLFVFLQESFIQTPGKIPYLWRGNFHLTPGTGNSAGCLTLTSSNISVVEARNISNRAHVLVCQKMGDLRPTFNSCKHLSSMPELS